MSDLGTSSKDALQQLLDGLQSFIREHLALARVEMKEDLRGLGRDLAIGAAGMPALAAGYLLSMIAIGYLLAVAPSGLRSASWPSSIWRRGDSSPGRARGARCATGWN